LKYLKKVVFKKKLKIEEILGRTSFAEFILDDDDNDDYYL
jgi:hypothetical protein